MIDVGIHSRKGESDDREGTRSSPQSPPTRPIPLTYTIGIDGSRTARGHNVRFESVANKDLLKRFCGAKNRSSVLGADIGLGH